ncbi:Thaumatin family domain containing protein [Russula decolorans]
MIFYPLILTLLLPQLPSATARSFTVVNLCTYTIWHIYTDLSVAQNVPQFPTGWESPPYTSAQFSVPDNWKSGRIWVRIFSFLPNSFTARAWLHSLPDFCGRARALLFGGFQGRRDCNFSTTAGVNSCLDGGCNGGLQCDPHTGTGVPPATVAEWTLQSNGSQDFYDVSVVDGFNIPMMIIPSANCSAASCPNDLNPGCPSQLIGPRNSSGNAVGCKSACVANLDNASDSANCCTGSHNTNATCPSSGVQFYSYFKNGCPNSYVYAYDESSGTALWTCNSTLNSDYRLTFCPPPYGGQSPSPISAVPSSLIPSVTSTPSSGTGSSTASGSRPSSSGNPGFKSGTLAILRAPMAPAGLSVLGFMLGWLVLV